jgi:thiol:disulfide interchange protein DsbG
MLNRRLALACLSASALWLTACSKEEASAPGKPAAGSPIDTAQAFDAVAAGAKGFAAGAMMSAHTVYVLFDPQCPHCSHLWEASLPLQGKVKFIWAPVAIIGAKSLPQGAALMQAANPVEAMTVHEKSLLAGQGGTSASASVPAEIEAAIKANTELLDRLGADSVPFIVARHAGSGQPVTRAGSMDTAGLASFLGLPPPQ